jgi:hypothetical protein
MSNPFLVTRLPPVIVRSQMMTPGRAVWMTASIGIVTDCFKIRALTYIPTYIQLVYVLTSEVILSFSLKKCTDS